MRNAFNKEIFREIKNTLDRFLAIFVIIALGVSFYTGIGTAGAKMRFVQDRYLTEQGLMDIRVVSNYGLNDNDIKAISEVEGVKQIFATYNIDAIVEDNGVSLLLKVHGLDMDSEINRPYLISGRFPEKNSEAVAEQALLNALGINIGDTITLESGKNTNLLNDLRTKRYTIVGTIMSPYYISNAERGNGSIGNGSIDCFIMIPQDNFYQDVYSEVFLTVEGAEAYLCFESEYQDLVGEVIERLEALEPIRATERAAEMTQKAYENLNRQSESIRNKRLEAYVQFDEMELQLSLSERALERSSQEVSENRRKANQSLLGLKGMRETIANGINEINTAIETVQETRNGILANMTELETYSISYGAEAMAVMRNRLDEGLSSANQAIWELETQKEGLNLNLIESDMLIRETELSLRLIEQSERRILESRAELYNSRRELEDSKRQTEMELEEAELELKRLREVLDDIGEPDWYILDRESNAGFLSYREDSDKIQAIGRTFPLFFFLVAALICLTTMTRLVEERRTEIGTLKALGYSEMKILSKYVIYATVPTVLGGILGGYLGMALFPEIIVNAYRSLYTIQESAIYIDYRLWATGIMLGAVTTIVAAVLTCKNELKETPASLLRPKPPKTGKKTIFESITFLWKRLSFTYKVTIRNIVRYKKRFFMTVFGIGGCTGLLLAGFGLRNSINDLANKQFGQIFLYDMKVTFSDNVKQKDVTHVRDYIESNPSSWGSISAREKYMDAGHLDGTFEKITLVVPEEPEYFGEYIVLKERTTQNHLELDENSVIINEKLAKLLMLSVGDEFIIKDGDRVTVEVEVTGICENYFNNYVYMHGDVYRTLFNEEVEYNTLYSLLDPSAAVNDLTTLANGILDKKNVNTVSFTADVLEPFNKVIDSLNIVIFVIVVSAGILAFVVLYNLTNININERIRELATIEVLGFNDKEVANYVYRENIILTVTGILMGFLLGYFLHFYLINTVESRLMMFSREIWLSSYIYASIITIIFSLGVNKITSAKLKKINMVEALKSIE